MYTNSIVYDIAKPAAQKRTLLGIEFFLGKPQPGFSSDMGEVAKLALFAKENITLDILPDPTPENVQLPLEPIHENTIQRSSAQSEREQLARKAQLKLKWENRCLRQTEIRVICTLEPRRLKRRLYVLPQPWNRIKEHWMQMKPAPQDGYIDYCWHLANPRGRINSST